jgi:hypothetical protein
LTHQDGEPPGAAALFHDLEGFYQWLILADRGGCCRRNRDRGPGRCHSLGIISLRKRRSASEEKARNDHSSSVLLTWALKNKFSRDLRAARSGRRVPSVLKPSRPSTAGSRRQ